MNLLLNGETRQFFPQSVLALLLQSAASKEVDLTFQFASESQSTFQRIIFRAQIRMPVPISFFDTHRVHGSISSICDPEVFASLHDGIVYFDGVAIGDVQLPT